MQAIDERDMDKISDAIKVAIRVGVDSTIVSQAKASAVQIENEFAAAEAAAIEAEEAEQHARSDGCLNLLRGHDHTERKRQEKEETKRMSE